MTPNNSTDVFEIVCEVCGLVAHERSSLVEDAYEVAQYHACICDDYGRVMIYRRCGFVEPPGTTNRPTIHNSKYERELLAAIAEARQSGFSDET